MKPNATRSTFARLGVLLLGLLVGAFLSGCAPGGGLTPQAQTALNTAGTVISGIASAAPLACTVVTAEDGTAAGNACSQDTQAASSVAQMVQKLIASFAATTPAAARKMASTAAGTVELKIMQNGSAVDVTLPPALASYVAAHYPTSAQ